VVDQRGPDDKLCDEIGVKERRKLRGRKQKGGEIRYGLGAFGLIGWTVALPTTLFTFLGVWLDRHHPVHFSWTLTLLVAGLAVGCLNAWYWINRERQDILRDREGNGNGCD